MQFQNHIRNPGTTAVLTAMFPGLGHLYNGQIITGIVAAPITVFLLSAALYDFFFTLDYVVLVIYFIYWIVMILHAHNYAVSHINQ